MRLLLRRRFFRLLAASANEYDLELCHFDADGVFLRVDLKEDLFMRLPKGCGELPGNIVMMNKSLYGLRQASRQWYAMFEEVSFDFGFSSA